MPQKAKWYHHPIPIAILLILFFPVGAYLMWRYTHWSTKKKIIISVILGFFFLISLSNLGKTDSQVAGNQIEVKPFPSILPTSTLSPSPEVTGIVPVSPSPMSTPPTSTGLVKVIRVIDGDTIEIEGGQKLRYIGIDTPETVDPRTTVQCFGSEASAKNKELVEGKSVRLEKDISETDKYGRLLRYVWVGDTFVNDYMVRQGYAKASSYPPDVKYQNQLTQAQQEAVANNRGLWSSCSSETNTTSKVQPTQSTVKVTQQSGSCNVKGNISADGEKIYHVPGCQSYTKTVIDTTKGERMFCSESEAQQAGWRKAGNCP